MMRSHIGRRLIRVAPWIGAAFIAVGSLTACNYKWEAFLTTFQFEGVQFVSAFPAHRDDAGNYTRQCLPDPNRPANALLFSFNIVGTEVAGSEDTSLKDNDRSIRPNDLIKNGTRRSRIVIGDSVKKEEFSVNISCMEPYPDGDINAEHGCQGAGNPGSDTDFLEYVSNFSLEDPRPSPADVDSIIVAVLIDQSGSMKGLVEDETKFEITEDSLKTFWGIHYGLDGTDPKSMRNQAVTSFFGILNSNDRGGVFQFNSDLGENAKIVCDLLETEAEETRRQTCFTYNRDVYTKSNVFANMQVYATGRTPLWSAVSDLYTYLDTKFTSKSGKTAKHIIVITDGPDTCYPGSPDTLAQMRYRKPFGTGNYQKYEQSDCSSVGYLEASGGDKPGFRETVMTDTLDDVGVPMAQNNIPVHVSFVQIQSPGYPNRDPNQQEVACLTGGQYIFVNWQDVKQADDQDDERRMNLFTEALQRIRWSLAGFWNIGVSVASMENGSLPKGYETAIDASITFQELNGDGEQPELLSDTKNPQTLTLRIGPTADTTPYSFSDLDYRGSIRIPCASGDLCQLYPFNDGDCEDRACRDDDMVCGLTNKAEGTTCKGENACCWGDCTFADVCLKADELCNIVADGEQDRNECGEDGNVCCDGGCEKPFCCNGDACSVKCCGTKCLEPTQCKDVDYEACKHVYKDDNVPCEVAADNPGVCCKGNCTDADVCDD